MYSNRQLTIHSGRCAAILAVVLLCVACAGPAVVEAPTPGPTSSPLPAPPTVTPSIQAEEPEPTRTVAPTATGAPTVLSTATPPAAETAIAMSAGDPASCGEAHAARPEESTDL
ncbi:MAG: hypothetical protein M3380_14480, partial [Chloroflexota bacterium]|nr:hypothetical protein [Chloroflexota bacterium]